MYTSAKTRKKRRHVGPTCLKIPGENTGKGVGDEDEGVDGADESGKGVGDEGVNGEDESGEGVGGEDASGEDASGEGDKSEAER